MFAAHLAECNINMFLTPGYEMVRNKVPKSLPENAARSARVTATKTLIVSGASGATSKMVGRSLQAVVEPLDQGRTKRGIFATDGGDVKARACV